MAADAAPASNVVAELERLSAAAVQAMSQRDWAMNNTAEAREVQRHIASDWSGTFDGVLGKVTLAELIETHRQFFLEHPQAYYRLRTISTTIDPVGTTASVHLNVDIVGMEGVTIPGLSEFRWKWAEGRWLWFSHIAMRKVDFL